MPDKYILIGTIPVPTEDLWLWAEWFETHDAERIVAATQIEPGIRVSTVFLGVADHWKPDQYPLLFETMIFGGPHDCSEWRWSTWEEAERGHRAIVSAMRRGGDLDEAVVAR